MTPAQDMMCAFAFVGSLFAAAVYTTPARVVPPAPTQAEATQRDAAAVQAYINAQRAHDAAVAHAPHATSVPDYAVAAGAQNSYRRMARQQAMGRLVNQAREEMYDHMDSDAYYPAAERLHALEQLRDNAE